MIYQVIWFVLWGTLWALYFMTDGFDLGAGILHRVLGRTEEERKIVLRTFSPLWDGNEVWLVTAGGATFAAFPTTYALMFSYLYTALLLILFSLILRGVGIEFRNKAEGPAWRACWDIAIFIGSFLPALLFGIAFGNIFQGLPMDAAGYHGSFLSLLNPYGLLTGLLFVLLFMVHGAIWISMRTEGDLKVRASALALRLWYGLVLIAVIFLVATARATGLYHNYLAHPVLFLLPAVAVVALLLAGVFTIYRIPFRAFTASSLAILCITFTGIAGLYPALIPSSLDPEFSLTIFNSSSSPYTLKIMTFVALVFVPIVISYQIWIYRVFRGPVTGREVTEGEGLY